MKKKIMGIISVCFLIGLMVIPVQAGNSYLDIKPNDIYSLKETKDDDEKNYYVKPTTYSGTYVRVRSRCLPVPAYASGYNQVIKDYKSHGYGYGRTVAGGYVYQMDGYGSPGSSWHLIGTWCP